ncbi:undecaprenyl-diphosphatase [Pectobacteriaceae bacterium CE70]|nr:undecaprenyl-diphosphatase [Serratia sp. ATCC 39006]WJV63307.1 undecaprenyl-diphosphatase [Pectobacteriaceae bacterium C52]WJV67676.1 undecaprenyl-diphosphatase [Pectobacteriaceae bacterium CE70]WJY11619.1 undecaprenyl-diphosphatase [Pectobacteriaceae bacterium C80]
MFETLNRAWFLSINAQPGTPEGIITFARFCADGTIFFIPVLLLWLWFFTGETGRRQALFCALTIEIALGLGALSGLFYFHPRPFMISLGYTWIHHTPDNSFPSDHATLLISAGLSLFMSRAKITGSIVMTLALFAAWARVFLGVHFPMDMVGAAVVSVLAYGIAFTLWKWWGDALTTLCAAISAKLFFWLPKRFTPQ